MTLSAGPQENSELSNTADSAVVTESLRLRKRLYLLLGVIAAGMQLALILGAPPLQSANDRSRWCTIASLITEGTFRIDNVRQRPGWNTIDLVHVDGHFYSTKPPLLAVVAAGTTWCVLQATGWDLFAHTQSVAALVLLFLNWLPFCLSLYCLAGILEKIACSPSARVVTFATACFATLLSPFLATLNNHTVAAAALMVALWALLQAAEAAPRGRWGYLLLCGLATGWTVCNELPAAACAVLLFGLAWRRWPAAAWTGFVPGVTVLLLAFLGTNYLATGNWKPAYAGYGTEQYRFVIDGVPSYWMHPQGVDRNVDSPAVYIFHCVVGHHGLLSLTPMLLLVPIGWFRTGPANPRELRLLTWGGAALTFIVLAFYWTRTENYNYGGVSCALRWMLWLIPFWLLALPAGIDAICDRRDGRWMVAGLLMASVYSAWEPQGRPWQQPWLFRQMERAGWIQYSEAPPDLPRPLWTWFDRLPDPTSEVKYVEFTSQQPLGGLRTWRISALRQRDLNGRLCVEVESRRSEPGVAEHVQTFWIDRERFAAGEPPGKCLVWPDSGTVLGQQMADLALVRGLPLLKGYRGGVIRYVHTDLRRDAFECQRAASQLDFAAVEGQPASRYRTDLWLSQEIPFGTAQLEFTVSHPQTGEVLTRERWTVSRCWPEPATTGRPQ